MIAMPLYYTLKKILLTYFTLSCVGEKLVGVLNKYLNMFIEIKLYKI